MTRRQDLHDRLRRAESWILAADRIESTKLHEAFLFFYIALNALYGRRQYEGDRTDFQADTRTFLDRILSMHESDVDAGGSILLNCLISRREAIGRLVGDHFLIDGLFRNALPAKIKAQAQKDRLKALTSLATKDPRPTLQLVLLRLNVLRNRVMHGCVRYGSTSKGLPSIEKALPVIRSLVPAFVELMTAYGHHLKWDPIPYPRVGYEDPSGARSQ